MSGVSRFIEALPEAVYRACTDLDAIVQWRVPEGMTGQIDSADGATYRMSLTYGDGRVDSYEATVVERVPNARIVERIRFDSADRPGEMTVTTALRAAEGGTEVTIAYEGLPRSIRPQDNDEGTRQALGKLAALVGIRAEIDRRLAVIEREHGVEIFYACESGSRAWDFASPNSDYDVRFLYRHPRDWYLSLSEQRDVIETPIEDNYDINGWDLRKALRLALNGNPVLFEWLSSPIRYLERPLATGFRDAVSSVFDPVKAYHHYLSTARRQRRTDLAGEAVQRKKYFYAVRPLLACQYLLAHRGTVPMRLFDLVDAVAPPAALRDALIDLWNAKRRTSEAATSERLPVLDRWIDRTLDELATLVPQAAASADRGRVERFFRTALDP